MPNFSLLQALQPPRVVAALPSSGGSAPDNAGDLLSGLGDLIKGISGKTGQPPNAQPGPVDTSLPNPSNPIQSPQDVASREVAKGLNPKMQEIMPLVMADLKAQGFDPVLASGYRTPQEQAEKVRQGASHTMHSQHTTGSAIDVVDRRWGWDIQNHKEDISRFAQAMKDTAAKYGLTSGTKWSSFGPFGDFAHLELSRDHSQLADTMKGIAYVESGDAKDPYQLVGPNTRGGQALGKYQIMSGNLPSWSKEAVGRPVSRNEFLSNPDLQEQIASYHVGRILKENSPENTASIWFTGRPLNRVNKKVRDSFGTTNEQYQEKFLTGMNMTDANNFDQSASASRINQNNPNPLALALGFQSKPQYPLPIPNIPAFRDKPIRDLTPEEIRAIMRNLHGSNNQMDPSFMLADANVSKDPTNLIQYNQPDDGNWILPPNVSYSGKQLNVGHRPGSALLIDDKKLQDSPNFDNSPFYNLI